MQARSRTSVLSVGRLYCDLIFTDVPRLPTLGTEVFAGGFGIHAGGGAFITAAHLVALGRPAGLAAMLPGEPFSGAVRADLGRSGVDLTLCAAADPGLDPQVTVSMARGGDRAFLTRRTGPAIPPLSPAKLSRQGIGHLHIGELATLVERPDLIALARGAGMTVSLDCSWDDALTAEAVAASIARVDVFLPNEEEVAHLRHLGVTEPFAPVTVVKCGADGAWARAEGKTLRAPACAAEVVDTTGAGDAFNAGFLHAWLSGRPMAECLAAGNRSGAASVATRGGFGAPPGGKTARDRAPALDGG